MPRIPRQIMNVPGRDLFDAREPKYLMLAKAIARDIRSGVPPVGELLPSEAALCRRFGVGRHTVREALRNLREVGLVSVHHGIGTRVKAVEVKPRHIFALGAIEDFLRYVAETDLRINRRERVAPSLASVDLPEVGEDWLVLEGMRYPRQASDPICWTQVFLNPAFPDAAETTGESRDPLFVQIERRYGERAVEIEQQITAVSLTRELAAMLNAKPASPALSTLRRYLGEGGRVLFVTVTIHPADRFRYDQRLHRETGTAGA